MPKGLAAVRRAVAVWLTVALLAASTSCALGPSQPVEVARLKRRGAPVIHLGIMPTGSVSELFDKTQPLADYLAEQVKADVRLVPMRSYEELVRELGKGDIEAAVSGSLVGYEAIRDGGAVPLARPETEGRSTYEGLILVRRGTGVTRLTQLRGKTFGMVSGTSAGELFPKYLLWRQGSTPQSFFARVNYLPTHSEALAAVLAGRVDGVAVKDTEYEKLVAHDSSVAQKLRVIARSRARFPESVVIAAKTMDARLRDALKSALLSADSDPDAAAALERFGAERFVATSVADYAGVRLMAAAVVR